MPGLVMRYNRDDHSWPSLVMRQSVNDHFIPRLVMPLLDGVFCRPWKWNIYLKYDQSAPRLVMSSLSNIQSWPGKVMVHLKNEQSRIQRQFLPDRMRYQRNFSKNFTNLFGTLTNSLYICGENSIYYEKENLYIPVFCSYALGMFCTQTWV